MSENRREIMCATRRYHHGRDFGELFSFFFFFFQEKNWTTSSLFFFNIYFLSTLLLKEKYPVATELDLNFDGDTLLLLPRPQYQGCLLAGHRYWIYAFEMIHPSIHLSISAPAEKPTRQHARLIDNFQSQRGSRCRFFCSEVERGRRSEGHAIFTPFFPRYTISRSKSQSNWIHRTHKSGFLGRAHAQQE